MTGDWLSRPQAVATGQVVWHDLLTTDIAGSREFYAALMGWEYLVERATEFVWGTGEADYPLILAAGEAHGGIVEIAPDRQSRWLAYVVVDDVDQITRRSGVFGASMERPPFDVPGVGRSSVIRDAQGALICPFKPSHSYPPPEGVFVRDDLISRDPEAAIDYYQDVFGWRIEAGGSGNATQGRTIRAGLAGSAIGLMRDLGAETGGSRWVPYLAVADVQTTVERADAMGAKALRLDRTGGAEPDSAILSDPTGAAFGVIGSTRTAL